MHIFDLEVVLGSVQCSKQLQRPLAVLLSLAPRLMPISAHYSLHISTAWELFRNSLICTSYNPASTTAIKIAFGAMSLTEGCGKQAELVEGFAPRLPEVAHW